MPIYEFYCPDCHTVFNFFSKSVNTAKRPLCPRCGGEKLTRMISSFAVTGKAGDRNGMDDLPIDETKMENAINTLAGEVENINEDDPKQAARLMRKFSDMTGIKYGNGIEQALSRMDEGENPEEIESELGNIIEQEEPFIIPGKRGKTGKAAPHTPRRDETLYEM